MRLGEIPLTRREHDLRERAGGFERADHDAARKLFIGASTVKRHLDNIYAKLAVRGRVEAIARARAMKLL